MGDKLFFLSKKYYKYDNFKYISICTTVYKIIKIEMLIQKKNG